MMCRLQLLLLLLSISYCRCQSFTIPEATLELLSPRGLKISIPDTDPAVTLVAFHVSVNEEFYGVEHGQWAQDILKRKNGRWTYTIPELTVKRGDTIYYWVYAIKNGLGYQNLDRKYDVLEDNPHGSTQVVTRPTTTPTVVKPSTAMPSTARPIISPDLIDSRKCEPSLTSVRNILKPICTGHVVFSATYHSDNDLEQWKHAVYTGGNDLESAFTVFTKHAEASKISRDNLVIKPLLLEEIYSRNFITSGTLDLEGCTSVDNELCRAQAVAWNILPPIMSARLTTKKSFSFRYGIVEIKAKLPKGNWIVPELWLEPVDRAYGANSGRIVMALSRGNHQFTVDGNIMSNQVLEAGVVIDSSRNITFRRTQDGNWGDGYHVYKLVWNPAGLEFYVDGQEIGRLTPSTPLDHSLGGDKLAPFDKDFYIALGVHVGGLRDFPDTALSAGQSKPWRNTDPKAKLKFWLDKDNWYPSWNQDSALFIESVKISAL